LKSIYSAKLLAQILSFSVFSQLDCIFEKLSIFMQYILSKQNVSF